MAEESDKKEETSFMFVCSHWRDRNLPKPASFYMLAGKTRCSKCVGGLGVYENLRGEVVICDYYKLWSEEMREKNTLPGQENERRPD